MHSHPRSFNDRIFTAWRSPNRFTKNPDIIKLPSGRLLLVYSDTDGHWAQQSEVITLLKSDDDGRTWVKYREIETARQPEDDRLVTPRISILNDGRLVVLCDHDDFGYFHEDQESGNWAWWSEDNGETWSGHRLTGIMGFEPDRMIDLPDGTLGVSSHIMRGESQEFAQILSVSEDGGKTWKERATIAHDGYHRFCEGAVVILNNGNEIACVMRENHSAGIPCFAVFSKDSGRTWSPPQMLPFALHRPYAKQLPDGRVLVTGRHVNGGAGTYAWCGDLRKEAGTWSVGGPRSVKTINLSDEALVIEHGASDGARYSLLPPESARSTFSFEARVRIEGPPDAPAAIMSVGTHNQHGGKSVVYLSSNRIGTSFDRPDRNIPVDMTEWRKITLRHRKGLFEVLIDGEKAISGCVFHDQGVPSEFHGANPQNRTTFGQIGESGKSFWRSVSYEVENPTLENTSWKWEAAGGEHPDQYQRERLVQFHANDPHQAPNPDHGYSSWLCLDDGTIAFVDYTNCGDTPGLSHIVGLNFRLEEI
jgi:hypothetical protein